MAKNKSGSKDREAKKSDSSRKRRRREVQVVSCQPDFPISTKPRENREVAQEGQEELQQSFRGDNRNQNLDWNDTAHEIRSLGASAFVGQQKRNFEDETYEKLTGRKKKRQHVPLPIARGIKKKAAERLDRQIKEAKESGMVLPKSLTRKKKKAVDSTSRIHGPAPSVGFMSKGMLKIKKPSK